MLKLQARLDYVTLSNCILFDATKADRDLELALLRSARLASWSSVRSTYVELLSFGLTDLEKSQLTSKVYQNAQQPIPDFTLASAESIRAMLNTSDNTRELGRLNTYLSEVRAIMVKKKTGGGDYRHPAIRPILGLDDYPGLRRYKLADDTSEKDRENIDNYFDRTIYIQVSRGVSGLYDSNYWNRVGSDRQPNPYLASMSVFESYDCAVEKFEDIALAIVDENPILIASGDNYKGGVKTAYSLSMEDYTVRGSRFGNLAADAFWLAMLSCGSGKPVDSSDRVMGITLAPYHAEAGRRIRAWDPEYKASDQQATIRPMSHGIARSAISQGMHVILDAELLGRYSQFSKFKDLVNHKNKHDQGNSDSATFIPARLTIENSRMLDTATKELLKSEFGNNVQFD